MELTVSPATQNAQEDGAPSGATAGASARGIGVSTVAAGQESGTGDCFDAIPDELKRLSQWLAWLLKSVRGKRKPDKKPIDPKTRKDGSSTDASTWGTFDEAVGLVRRDRRYAGIGFALRKDDGYVIYDFDDCCDATTGEPLPWVQACIQRLNTYAEYSPSNCGVRAVVRGALPNGETTHKIPDEGQGRLEIYSARQFLTFTGRRLDGIPRTIATHADALAPIRRASEDVPESAVSEARPACADDELLARARDARYGEEFARLYDHGDLSAVNGDDSVADLKLCSQLAFWTGKTEAQIDRLFRRSKLMRPKWDHVHAGDRSTYGEMTIRRAVEGCHTTYGPITFRRSTPPHPQNGHHANGVSLAYDKQDRRPVQLFELYMSRSDLFRDRGELQGGSARTLNAGFYRGHVQGQKDLAVFPLRPDATCTWAAVLVPVECTDHLLGFIRLLEADGISSVVIREDAARFTLTVLVVTAVRAKLLRAVLRAAATEAGLSPLNAKIIPSADSPTGADAKRAGDCVPLPYHGAVPRMSESGRRPTQPPDGCRVAVDLANQRDLSLDAFLERASAARVQPSVIYEAAEHLGVVDLPSAPQRPDGLSGAAGQRAAGMDRRRERQALRILYGLLRRQRINGTDFVVAMEISKTADAAGVSWVSREEIADRLKRSRASIYRAFKALRRESLIESTDKRVRGQRFKCVGHRLTLAGAPRETTPPAGQTARRPRAQRGVYAREI